LIDVFERVIDMYATPKDTTLILKEGSIAPRLRDLTVTFLTFRYRRPNEHGLFPEFVRRHFVTATKVGGQLVGR
jgi:hypothetical protein